MRNSNKAPKFSTMTEYELQNFYSNKKERRKNVRQELSIYIVWSSAAINLGPRWKRGYPYIMSFCFFTTMVFCYQNCSDLLWEIIVLVNEKNFWNLRLKAENFQNFWDHLNNLFKQWKVRTIFGNRMLF